MDNGVTGCCFAVFDASTASFQQNDCESGGPPGHQVLGFSRQPQPCRKTVECGSLGEARLSKPIRPGIETFNSRAVACTAALACQIVLLQWLGWLSLNTRLGPVMQKPRYLFRMYGKFRTFTYVEKESNKIENEPRTVGLKQDVTLPRAQNPFLYRYAVR